MFPFKTPSTSPVAAPSDRRQLLKRGLTLCAGLLLLWLALNIMPKPDASHDPVIFSDDTGTVATSASLTPSSDSTPLISPGQLIAIVLLAGLLGGTLYWNKKKAAQHTPVKQLHNLGRIQLGPQQHIHLIECGDEAFLVGATQSQITLIQKLPLTSIQLAEKTESTAQSIKTDGFSSPSSTLIETQGFAALLQHQTAALPLQESHS